MNPICTVMVPHPPLIVPEIGRGQEKKIQKTIDSFKRAACFLADAQPETIVIISPHSTAYADYFHISPGPGAKGSFAQFGAGGVRLEVEYDTALVSAISRAADRAGIPAGTLGERDKSLDHGTLVPLYFINEAYGGEIKARVVRIGLSGLSYSEHYKLGILIREASNAENRKIAVVASGDLSHRLKADGPYGYKEEGPLYDSRIMHVMGNGDFGELFDFEEVFCEAAGECGHRSFIIMAGCFDGMGVRAEKLSYEGPFGVGYGVCIFTPDAEDAKRHFLDEYEKKHRAKINERRQKEDEYVRLARRALETYVREGEVIPVPKDLPDEMLAKRAGVFVSLHKRGQLRGCIGTISATTESIAREIINNAISASTHDPRFNPVSKDELDELEYSVDVLGEIEDISSPQELDVKRYGVIVTSGHRRGLLLSNLEGIDTVEQQIDIAKRKAGIREGEKVSLQRFEVVRHF